MSGVDGAWLLDRLEALATFGADPRGGVSRPAYSPADLEAREWLDGELRNLGFAVTVDGARNTIARFDPSAGGDDSLPSVALL